MFIDMIALILGIILGVIGIYLVDTKDTPRKGALPSFLLMLGGVLIYGGLTSISDKRTPQAIDVYRGKTTLQITYQDSIPVDSVVIFKNKNGNKKCNTDS